VVQSDSYKLNLFTHNNTYLLINFVFFRVLPLELHSVSPTITPPFKTFFEGHCLKLEECVCQFCTLPFNNILNSIPCDYLWKEFWFSFAPLSKDLAHADASSPQEAGHIQQNLTHVQSAVNLWTDPSEVPNILATLCTSSFCFWK
jgi:hypothetical protein